MATIATDAQGMPKILTIYDRRYVVCNHQVAGTLAYCGELIDVTDRQITMTMDCGKPENHGTDRECLDVVR